MKNVACIMSFAALLALTALAAPPASAMSPNLEYYQEYEALYLNSCMKTHGAKECQRRMEALQQKLGFWDFAILISSGRTIEIAALDK